MKRLMMVSAMAIALLGLSAATAQASLTMQEAKSAALEAGSELSGSHFPRNWDVRDCSRLGPDQIRCSVAVTFETYWNLKSCKSRVSITEKEEITTRFLRKRCQKLEVPFLSFERAIREAGRAMDPHASRYGTGSSASTDGRNRFQVEISWEFEGQACMQSSRVRLVDDEVLVNVSEVSCVDIPDWPKQSR